MPEEARAAGQKEPGIRKHLESFLGVRRGVSQIF
jgi:hypothetical protein